MNVEAFLNEYGDDYLALGKEERDFYCGLLAEERAERTTAIRKVGKHALADINATLQSISSAVSCISTTVDCYITDLVADC